MANTYRKRTEWIAHDESDDFFGTIYRFVIHRRQRDRKPWNKPNKRFKNLNRKAEKAKVRSWMRKLNKDCLIDGEIGMPIFRKYDRWDWL